MRKLNMRILNIWNQDVQMSNNMYVENLIKMLQIVMLEVQKKKKLTTKPNSKKLVKLTQCFQIHGKRPVTMPVKMSKMATRITIISTIPIIWMLPKCSRLSLGVVLECIMLINIILDLEVHQVIIIITKCLEISFNLAEF